MSPVPHFTSGSGVEELLDGFDSSRALALCELAAVLCDAPVAGASLITSDGRRSGGWYGTPTPTVPVEQTPCAEVMESGSAVVMGDVLGRVRPDGAAWELDGLRAYVGVPIRVSGGRTLGTVCVFDTVPREFTAAQLRGLAIIAAELGGGLEMLVRAREADRERLRADAELAESQQRFHALVESSPLAIFAMDAQTRPVFVSDGCAHLFGTARNRYDQTGWIPAVHEDDRERTTGEWRDAVSSQTSLETQFRIHDPEGSIRQIVSRAVAMHTPTGEFSGWVGTITDVTEQVAVTAELAHARHIAERVSAELEVRNEELQALAHAKDDVLAAVSHELRTPITSITTVLRLLAADDGLSDTQREAVAVITRNVDRLDRLVGDLLAGKDEPVSRPVRNT
jgi:PAS domain S-box-containing protein